MLWSAQYCFVSIAKETEPQCGTYSTGDTPLPVAAEAALGGWYRPCARCGGIHPVRSAGCPLAAHCPSALNEKHTFINAFHLCSELCFTHKCVPRAHCLEDLRHLIMYELSDQMRHEGQWGQTDVPNECISIRNMARVPSMLPRRGLQPMDLLRLNESRLQWPGQSAMELPGHHYTLLLWQRCSILSRHISFISKVTIWFALSRRVCKDPLLSANSTSVKEDSKGKVYMLVLRIIEVLKPCYADVQSLGSSDSITSSDVSFRKKTLILHSSWKAPHCTTLPHLFHSAEYMIQSTDCHWPVCPRFHSASPTRCPSSYTQEFFPNHALVVNLSISDAEWINASTSR